MDATEKKYKNIEEFSEIKNSLYKKMLDNDDHKSAKMLNDMFCIFIDHGGSEFIRGLDVVKEIYK